MLLTKTPFPQLSIQRKQKQKNKQKAVWKTQKRELK
jgi:hypothetical protein